MVIKCSPIIHALGISLSSNVYIPQLLPRTPVVSDDSSLIKDCINVHGQSSFIFVITEAKFQHTICIRQGIL